MRQEASVFGIGHEGRDPKAIEFGGHCQPMRITLSRGENFFDAIGLGVEVDQLVEGGLDVG